MWWRIGAAAAFLGVVFGAFGAHALEQFTSDETLRHAWDTGARYHQLNAVGILLAAAHPGQPKWTGPLFLVAIGLFSGSLYLLALTGIHVLGAITPIGGVFALAAWATLGWASVPTREAASTP